MASLSGEPSRIHVVKEELVVGLQPSQSQLGKSGDVHDMKISLLFHFLHPLFAYVAVRASNSRGILGVEAMDKESI